MRWCRIMVTLTVVWCGVMMMSLAMSTDKKEIAKPMRPSSFTSMDEVIDYVNRLRDYYKANTGGRFGKRSYMNYDLMRNYIMLMNRMH